MTWRTVARADADGTYDGVVDRERIMLYDQSWRLLEERIDDDYDAVPGDGADRVCQQVWGARYIDDAVLRRENTDFTNDSPSVTYNSTWYYATDALYSVVAMLSDTNGTPVERVRYLPYGTACHHRAADIDGDGDTDSNNGSVILNVWGAAIGTANYNCEALRR